MPVKRLTTLLAILVLAACSAYAWFHQKQLTVGWAKYEKGFQLRAGQGKSGGQAILCQNTDSSDAYGAQNVVPLNQTSATPFTVTAWSRSVDVSGTPDDGYSLYLDLTYTDGSHLWGTIAPFDCGTHDWQRRQLHVAPTKPVQDASVFVLLRRHTGQAWFSDVSISDGSGTATFDFQPIAAPGELAGEHWFIRDVASNSKIFPASQAGDHGLRAKEGSAGTDSHTLDVVDTTRQDRAVTLYYCEKVDALGGLWWNSIRNTIPIAQAECASLVSASSGANGLSSLYPFSAVTSGKVGRMLAVPPSLGPRVVRLFYNPSSRLLCAAFDTALVHANRAHPGEADASVLSRQIDGVWGFRDAARQYYQAFPDAFQQRIPRQGIWMPFTDPATIPHPEDFGIAVHEGDNSVKSDERLGILSFRYTEPMTWWMPMDPSIPRTYDAAFQILGKNLLSSDVAVKKQAQAVVSSGTFGPDGRTNVSFQNQPWANGAVWVLNPNPGLPKTPGKALQADIVFDPSEAKTRFTSTQLSGEYLDSLEAHSEVLDYRKESLASSSFSPSFDSSWRPVVPQGFSTFEIAQLMSSQLHSMGKLLFANSTPLRMSCYMPLLDCAGTEVNWMDSGSWSPDSDDEFCYRRTLCYHKPYMLLQNTDFSKFDAHAVAMYFKKCTFYGVFPSFFSADAATHPYWETPALYERDRALFKSTIPLIREIAIAGWEPVTNARTSDSSVFIERYGESTWTLFNNSSFTKEVSVMFDAPATGVKAKDLAGGQALILTPSGAKAKLQITLEPGDCRIVRLVKG